MSGEEGARLGRQHNGDAGDLVRFADPAQRRRRSPFLQVFRVLPQGAGEIGLDQARRDRIGADVMRSVLDGEHPGELHIRRLGDAIGAQGRAALVSADRRHDDDRAVLPLDHLRHHHVAEPEIALDVAIHDAVERLVGNILRRAEIGVHRRITDQHVDLAEGLGASVDKLLKLILVADMAGNRDGLVALFGPILVDVVGHRIAGVGLARGNDHIRTVFRHAFRNGLPNTLRGTGDDGRHAVHVEKGHRYLRVSWGRCSRPGDRDCQRRTIAVSGHRASPAPGPPARRPPTTTSHRAGCSNNRTMSRNGYRR